MNEVEYMRYVLRKSYRRREEDGELIEASEAKIVSLEADVKDLETQTDELRCTIQRQDTTIIEQDATVCTPLSLTHPHIH